MRTGILITLFMLQSGSVPAAELEAEQAAAIAQDALRIWKVPGAVVAVVHEDRQFVFGVGRTDLAGSRPMTADTIVPLASCTKAFTVAALAQLVDQGKLDWDDPVRKHLPDFQISDPHVQALISVRDLVSHRSGIKGHDLLWYRAPWNREEVFRRISNLPVDRVFRGSYEYSTILFMVAGKVAETVSGQSWPNLIRDRITAPLGMESVSFATGEPNFQRSGLPNGHRMVRDGRIVAVPLYETREANAAGSIHLAARDLLPWLRFQTGDGAVHERRLVSARQFGEIRKPLNPLPFDDALRRLNPDTVQMSYAMGWFLYDYRGLALVAHGGLIDGFRVLITVVPKSRLAIAVISTVQETRMNQALTNALVDRAIGLPSKDWNEIFREAVSLENRERDRSAAAAAAARRANVPTTVPLSEFAGSYVEPAYGTATIEFAAGKLVWKWSSFVVELEHWEADTFRFTSGLLEDRLLAFKCGVAGPESFQFEGQRFTRSPK